MIALPRGLGHTIPCPRYPLLLCMQSWPTVVCQMSVVMYAVPLQSQAEPVRTPSTFHAYNVVASSNLVL